MKGSDALGGDVGTGRGAVEFKRTLAEPPPEHAADTLSGWVYEEMRLEHERVKKAYAAYILAEMARMGGTNFTPTGSYFQ